MCEFKGGVNLPIFLLLVFELLLSEFLFRNPCHRNSCRLLRNLEMGLPCLQSSKLRNSHLCKLRNRQAPNCKLGNSHTLRLIHPLGLRNSLQPQGPEIIPQRSFAKLPRKCSQKCHLKVEISSGKNRLGLKRWFWAPSPET